MKPGDVFLNCGNLCIHLGKEYIDKMPKYKDTFILPYDMSNGTIMNAYTNALETGEVVFNLSDIFKQIQETIKETE